MANILVVEDDPDQLEDMLLFLSHCGHRSIGAASAAEMDGVLADFQPDVVLLDFNLPDSNGPALASLLRQRYASAVGIVMITARGMIADRIECRRAGADDYLVKPVDFDELQIVVENLYSRLRSEHTAESGMDNAWIVDMTQSRILPPDGLPVGLTVYECRLLKALAGEPEQLASRNTLVAALGKNAEVYDARALEVMISRLRKKLPPVGDDRVVLQAARGAGYKFVHPLIIKG